MIRMIIHPPNSLSKAERVVVSCWFHFAYQLKIKGGPAEDSTTGTIRDKANGRNWRQNDIILPTAVYGLPFSHSYCSAKWHYQYHMTSVTVYEESIHESEGEITLFLSLFPKRVVLDALREFLPEQS